jgi:hypothetical protein
MGKTRRAIVPTGDESNHKADVARGSAVPKDWFIGPIPIELRGLCEKLNAAGWPMEPLSLFRQLLAAKWPYAKIEEVVEAKIAKLKNTYVVPEHAVEIIKPGEETEQEYKTRREWDLYVLFFITRKGAHPVHARQEAEWLWGRFKTVDRWLAAGGEWHSRIKDRPMPKGFMKEWLAFVAENAPRTADDIEEELIKIEDRTPMW